MQTEISFGELSLLKFGKTDSYAYSSVLRKFEHLRQIYKL